MFHSFLSISCARAVAGCAFAALVLALPAGDARAQAGGASLRASALDRAKIRLADIDTPEVARPRCAREAELGRKATERLQGLLSAAPFRLEPAPGGRQQDRFGRELKVVKRGETSLGSVLVREGLAQRWGSQRRGWC